MPVKLVVTSSVLSLLLLAPVAARADDDVPAAEPAAAPVAAPVATPAEAPDETPAQGAVVARLEGSYVYRSIYGIGISGGGGEFAVGYEQNVFVWTIGVRGFAGSTPTGIVAGEGGLTATFEGRLGKRVRLGGGCHASLFDWGRVTTGDAVTYATGLYFRVSVDVVPLGETPHSGALVLAGTFGADLVLGSQAAPILWGPSIGAGARF